MLASLAVVGLCLAPLAQGSRADSRAREQAARVALGRAFFGASAREELLAKLTALTPDPATRPEIGWLAETRYLGTLLSRTLAQMRAMSDEELAEYRATWQIARELEHRRWNPLPGEIRGYGDAASRARYLRATRDLLHAKDRDDFLARTREQVERGYLTLLFIPRGGQGPSAYGLSIDAIAALDDRRFASWRTRFLRWVEIHTPGQSQVAKFAAMDEGEFDAMLRESQDRMGAADLKRALARLESRTGIALCYPRFVARETAPVIDKVAIGSPASASGLVPGDRITRVEDVAVEEWNDFVYWLSAYTPGSVVRLTVRAEADPPRTCELRIEAPR